MNRKIIMGVLSIVTALTMVAGVTFALFSAQNTNSGNVFAAGNLALSINTQTPTSTGVFSVSGVDPGETTGPQSLNLKNEGSVDASDVVVSSIVVNPTPASPNLGDKLILKLYKDDGDSVFNLGDSLVGNAVLTAGGWASSSLGFGLNAGASQLLFATIEFDSTAGNEFQGTSVSFDLVFQANQ